MRTQQISNLSTALPINYEFFFHFLDSQFPESRSQRVLDFGCGEGLLVREGKKRGYQIFGVDNFYEDAGRATEILSLARADGLPIWSITKEGTIPWPDGFFDVIISNMVMEHISQLDAVVAEFHRVIKEKGVMLHIFPTRERIMEGHIGLPFVHWFPVRGKMRRLWALFMLKLGFGFGWEINKRPNHEWVRETLSWVDNYVFYRSWGVVQESFSRFFELKSATLQELAFHLNHKQGFEIRIFQALLHFALTAKILERLYWRFRERAVLCLPRKT